MLYAPPGVHLIHVPLIGAAGMPISRSVDPWLHASAGLLVQWQRVVFFAFPVKGKGSFLSRLQ